MYTWKPRTLQSYNIQNLYSLNVLVRSAVCVTGTSLQGKDDAAELGAYFRTFRRLVGGGLAIKIALVGRLEFPNIIDDKSVELYFWFSYFRTRTVGERKR